MLINCWIFERRACSSTGMVKTAFVLQCLLRSRCASVSWMTRIRETFCIFGSARILLKNVSQSMPVQGVPGQPAQLQAGHRPRGVPREHRGPLRRRRVRAGAVGARRGAAQALEAVRAVLE